MMFRARLFVLPAVASLFAFSMLACKQAAPPAQMQAMPVQVQTVADSSVPQGDTYVSTIKSRRSATVQPQVDGNLTRILVKSGDMVKAGQLLMTIDPLKQQATVAQSRGSEYQAKSAADYAKIEENRQKQLFDAGVISRDAYDQAIQSLGNTAGAYNAAVQGTHTQQEELAYYQIRAPFAGVVGDIPVHQGDYVSPTTVLTTVDEPTGLEAYIYLPSERGPSLRNGMGVDLLDTQGALLEHTSIDFISAQVDNGLQSILVKAPVSPSNHLRTGQIINARVVFSTAQIPTVPVLATTMIGGQSFVYVAAPKGNGYAAHLQSVKLGDPVDNNYPVLSGLHVGDRVILSGLQFLQEGAPVQPLAPQPGPPASPPAGA
jgi:RND family efflux transporter MFP subunit